MGAYSRAKQPSNYVLEGELLQLETMSTVEEVHIEICSVCHPFYTGKQRLVDTAGRVDRFKKKYEKAAQQ